MGIPYAEVIGDPIAHSKSPLIHRFWLRQMGLVGDYKATRVTPEELADHFRRRRTDPDWRGCNVTLPHKETVVPLVDELQTWGFVPVNCIVPDAGRLIGRNTDMSGVSKILTEGSQLPICLIGAGGAARAAIAALDILAVHQFNVIARDPVRARPVVAPYEELGRVFGFDAASDAIRGCGGLINASPLGMDGFGPMPDSILDSLGLLNADAFVFDMVYAPIRTELLRRAAALGLKTVDGLDMLVSQAEDAFEMFFGEPPPNPGSPELRELLTR